MKPVSRPPASHRLQAIDATRGIAMLFVCVSPFGWAYLGRLPSHASQGALLEYVALIASPTFVTISGLLLGFLARVLGALVIKDVPLALKAAGLFDTGVLVWTLGWPLQKQPPSPAYRGPCGPGLLCS